VAPVHHALLQAGHPGTIEAYPDATDRSFQQT